MRTICVAIAGLVLAASSSIVSAGQFDIWVDPASKGNGVFVVVSFAGDGMTQDAQADISFGESLSLVSAQSKVEGSVCVGLPGKNVIRVVPPSGAGKALTNDSVDYCSFYFSQKGMSKAAGPSFKIDFVECASPDGMHGCGTELLDVSVK